MKAFCDRIERLESVLPSPTGLTRRAQQFPETQPHTRSSEINVISTQNEILSHPSERPSIETNGPGNSSFISSSGIGLHETTRLTQPPTTLRDSPLYQSSPGIRMVPLQRVPTPPSTIATTPGDDDGSSVVPPEQEVCLPCYRISSSARFADTYAKAIL